MAITTFRGNLRIGQAGAAGGVVAHLDPLDRQPWPAGGERAHEGLGLLASRNGQPEQAVDYLNTAFALRSSNYLAHYVYASEKFRPDGRGSRQSGTRSKSETEDIQGHLRTSIALMPAFGLAHYLLGRSCLETGEDSDLEERHLRRAAELEPENPAYTLSLASVQMARADLPGARRTLQSLLIHPLPRNLRARAAAARRGGPAGRARDHYAGAKPGRGPEAVGSRLLLVRSDGARPGGGAA